MGSLRQLVSHDHTPIHRCISPIPLLHRREMQVLKVSVIEEQRFALVEGNGAP